MTVSVELTKIVISRFWKLVDKNNPEAPVYRGTRCWLWKGYCQQGYGRVFLPRKGKRRKALSAHRLSWFIHYGFTKLNVLHHCDNPPCIRPNHLWKGTHADNQRDKYNKGRQAKGVRTGPYTHPEMKRQGEVHGQAKLSNVDVRTIRYLLDSGYRQVDLARKYNISRSTIHLIAKRRTWKCLL